jgi:aldose 1-epimerase
MTERPFGKMPDGRTAMLFEMINAAGMKAAITNFGGIIQSITVPDRKGAMADVTLGFDTLAPYLANPAYFGAIIGRTANRIANARFELNGKTYMLAANNGKNDLHGGIEGFDKKLWDAQVISEDVLRLSYTSADGEEGYPGKMDVTVTYTLDECGSIIIEYTAVSDKDTLVNLTNHAYFNLAGHNAGSVSGHILRIHAERFTPIDDEGIPTGEVLSVKRTPLDFTQPRTVGEGLKAEQSDEQLKNGHGYDHNFVIDKKGGGTTVAAEVTDPGSGRKLTVSTDQPGVQLYGGNFIDHIHGKGGAVYGRRSGMCLETQNFPDAINQTGFPSPILKAGEAYRTTTVYGFSTD